MKTARPSEILNLARLHGVQTSYVDMAKQRQPAATDSLLAVLQTLGAPVARLNDVPAALREARRALAHRVLEPVHVVWQGKRATVPLQLPDWAARGSLRGEWILQDGEVRRLETRLERLPVKQVRRVDGESFVTRWVPVPARLPVGYHCLALECGNDRFETQVFSAPERCFQGSSQRRRWGLFAPLYALHSERSWGAGDFGDLADFIQWVGEQGGGFVGTLPLLPAFLDQPCEPSPYSPVSRLFWNEFFLDLTRVPELDHCPAARRLTQSAAFQARLNRLRRDPVVNYAPAMALKRAVLEMLSRYFFSKSSARRRAFDQFLREHPHTEEYARFRAACERRREPWVQWPDRLRAGDLRDHDVRAADKQYHLYVQWLAHEQMKQLSEHARENHVDLYLDMPLGTHRDGYDCWRHQDLFALAASGGAPPDPVFTRGQDWGFAPIHPERSREQGHAYMIAYLRHHLRHASMLRFDHVMGLHRLYWVPAGMPASCGAYVSYPAEEFYAILSIESHRHRAVIIGENLGTVPPEVNRSLERHRVAGMFVGQYEFQPLPKPVLRPAPPRTVASLNTHDMPPFHGYWLGNDIEDRRALCLGKSVDFAREHRVRSKIRRGLIKLLRQPGWVGETSPNAGAVSRATHGHLAAGRARWVLVNLEDLWLESLSQNVPGTSTERVNWRRKARFSIEQFQDNPAVLEQLRRIHHLRQKPR